jgi:hypothetical protein
MSAASCHQLLRANVDRGGGWPAIVVPAAACGVVEEGLATQSLFNPDYAHQHLLSAGYLPALGIAVPWTVHVLSLHRHLEHLYSDRPC